MPSSPIDSAPQRVVQVYGHALGHLAGQRMQEAQPLGGQVRQVGGRHRQANGQPFALIAPVFAAVARHQRVVIQDVDSAILAGKRRSPRLMRWMASAALSSRWASSMPARGTAGASSECTIRAALECLRKPAIQSPNRRARHSRRTLRTTGQAPHRASARPGRRRRAESGRADFPDPGSPVRKH